MAVKPRSVKPALSLWFIDHSDAAKMKPADVARAIGVSEDTVRGWESGRGIGRDNLGKLEALFEEQAPESGDYASGDLAAAIRDQAEAIGRLADRLDAFLSPEWLAARVAEALRVAGVATGPAGSASPSDVRASSGPDR